MSHSRQTSVDRHKAEAVRAPRSVLVERSVNAQPLASTRSAAQAPTLSQALPRRRSTPPPKEGSGAQAPVYCRISDPLKTSKAKAKAKVSAPPEDHRSEQVPAQLPPPASRRPSSTVIPASKPTLQQRGSTQTTLVVPAGLSQEQRYRFVQSAAEAWRREKAQEYAQALALRKSEKKAKKKAKKRAAREAKKLREQAQAEQGEGSTAQSKPKSNPKRRLKHCAIL